MRSQRGNILIGALILVLILGFAAAQVAKLAATSSRSSTRLAAESQAKQLAHMGLQYALEALYDFDASCSDLQTYLGTITVNNDQITITGTEHLNISSLSSAINNTTDTIPANDASSFMNYGGLRLDYESMRYLTKTATTFTQTTRGTNSTLPAAHAAGIPAAQLLCEIEATATITMPGSDVVSQENIQVNQLPSTWIVGDNNNGDTFHHFDNVTVTREGPHANVTDDGLNAVNMLSYASAWAVGADQGGQLNINYFNGVTWSRQTAPAIASDLYDVYCNSSVDCWSVGQQVNNNSVLVQWNGTSWVRETLDNKIKEDLHGVHCANAAFCFTVGKTPGGGGGGGGGPGGGGPPGGGGGGGGGGPGPLVLQYNGTEWLQLKNNDGLDQSVPGKDLFSVYCNNASDCWAVGENNAGTLNVIFWDGVEWAAAANLPASNENLLSVFCNSTTDCWAVGTNNTMIHYDGTGWSSVTNGLPTVDLNDIYCNNSIECYTVGNGGVMGYYDGVNWFSVITPDTTNLNGVTSIPLAQQPLYFKQL